MIFQLAMFDYQSINPILFIWYSMIFLPVLKSHVFIYIPHFFHQYSYDVAIYCHFIVLKSHILYYPSIFLVAHIITDPGLRPLAADRWDRWDRPAGDSASDSAGFPRAAATGASDAKGAELPARIVEETGHRFHWKCMKMSIKQYHKAHCIKYIKPTIFCLTPPLKMGILLQNPRTKPYWGSSFEPVLQTQSVIPSL